MSKKHRPAQVCLDGQFVAVTDEQTIMDVALDNDCYIPHLCHHPDYPPQGNCKVCTVTVDGHEHCACTTIASSGMTIETQSTGLTELRRQLVELLFAEGNHYCPSCERAGNCQLQAIAYEVGMFNIHQPLTYPTKQLDASHKHIILDRDRCILCGLCVRASQSENKHVFFISGRGESSQLEINSHSGQLKDSALSRKDRAAKICPVGALLTRGEGFNIPIGKRLYDTQGIRQQGNKRPEYDKIQAHPKATDSEAKDE